MIDCLVALSFVCLHCIVCIALYALLACVVCFFVCIVRVDCWIVCIVWFVGGLVVCVIAFIVCLGACLQCLFGRLIAMCFDCLRWLLVSLHSWYGCLNCLCVRVNY